MRLSPPMSEQWITRYTLLQRAKDPNDHQAWDEFARYYQPFIQMVLFQMNYRHSDAEDVVQEVMLKIWQNLDRFKKDSARARFRTWLGNLIRNRVIDHIKSRQRFTDRNQKAVDEITIHKDHNVALPEVNEIVEREWILHIARSAMENVKPLFSGKAIEVFELSLGGMPCEEISKKTGLKLNSVHKLRARVRVRLTEEIQHLRESLEFKN